MQTQIRNGSSSGRPSLEYFPRPGQAPQRVVLERLPFTLGRVESADLQIDSTRVSREHAQIVSESGHYVLVDQGSTNGTYVNGKRIERGVLADGDTILVADSELTFIATAGDRIRRMATQLMTSVQPPRNSTPELFDAVDAVRRAHELLLHGLVFPHQEEIVTLPRRECFALYSAASDGSRDGPALSGSPALSVPSRTSARYRELQRSLTLEVLQEKGGDGRLMVDVDTWEVESNPSLLQHLARLKDLLPERSSLIVAIPADAACDRADVAQFAESLRDQGISTCFRDFKAGGSQLRQYRNIRPDFLELSPSMLRAGIRHDHQRTSLQSVIQACQTIDCRPIAAGVECDEVEEACCEMGFELMRRPSSRAGGSGRPSPQEALCAV